MKRTKRLLLLLLVICQLLTLLIGCSNKKEEETSEADAFALTLDLLKSYVIVVDRNGGEELKNVAASLQKTLEQKTGVKPVVKDDYVVAGSDVYCESEYEILLGNADRAESRDFYTGVRTKDHGYALVGKKLLILGHSSELVNKSAVRFQSDVLRTASDGAAQLLKAGDVQLIAGNYLFDGMTVNGVDISKYRIVYPDIFPLGEREFATYLQEWIASKTGYVIPCVSDFTAAAEYEIQIGDTSRVTDAARSQRDAGGFGNGYGYVGINGNGLWVSGKNREGIYHALNQLLSLTAEADQCLKLEIASPVLYEIHSFSVSAMSYNVYYDLNEKQRNPDDVIKSIKEKSPDVFGLNESGADWLAKMDAAMSDLYTCVKGRALENTADSSYNAIYYKKDKFELVESGTRWFSPTPDRVSKYPEAKHYKGMTYAILKDKATGAKFMYLNVHLDGSNEAAAHSALKEVRKKSAEVIKAFLADYTEYPIIMGGDFNEGTSSAVVTGFSQNGRFRYCGTEAKDKTILNTTDVNATFDALGTAVFDYLFVTGDCISVQKYEQWDNKTNGKYPSDHLPVYAELTVSY